MIGTHQLNWLFHSLSTPVYRCKNPWDPLIMIFFPEVSISRDIFPGSKFAQLLFFLGMGGWETEICFQVSFFSKGLNCLILNSRGFMNQTFIYSRAYWFLKICLSIHLCMDKNGITQCMGPVNKSLLADLMMMILNWNKTDGGCNISICVQTSI